MTFLEKARLVAFSTFTSANCSAALAKTSEDYEGINMVRLNQHKKDKHLQDLIVNFPCEHYEFNSNSMADLKLHKSATHGKEIKRDCQFKCTTSNKLKEHKEEVHKRKKQYQL